MSASNEIAEFAVKILKQYAGEHGYSCRSTSDLSPFEEWLIIKLYKWNDAYLKIDWPDVQEYMEDDTFDANSYPGEESSWFVRIGWLLEWNDRMKLRQQKIIQERSLEEMGIKEKPEPFDLVTEINKLGNDLVNSIKEISDIEAEDYILQLQSMKSISEEELSILNSADPYKAAKEYLKRSVNKR